MNVLLDTHIAIWAVMDSGKLDEKLTGILEDVDNNIYFSTASVWEIAVKHHIHPDQMPVTEEEFVSLCNATGFQQLDIMNKHIFTVKSLKRDSNAPSHNDPFDRLLISQAKSENLTFITHDGLLKGYNENCVMNV